MPPVSRPELWRLTRSQLLAAGEARTREVLAREERRRRAEASDAAMHELARRYEEGKKRR